MRCYPIATRHGNLREDDHVNEADFVQRDPNEDGDIQKVRAGALQMKVKYKKLTPQKL